ncbi:MAG: hypothetical protein ABW215_09055 [Kibdelosporangium sp.]
MDLFDVDPHSALLALAGRVPDGWLVIARELLADGETDRLTQLRSVVDVRPVGQPRFTPGTESDADRAVAASVEAVPGTTACWAVTRDGIDRMYLVQADDGIDLARLTATVQRAQRGSTLVEVFGAATALPAYHEAALLAATLLWSACPDVPVRIARTFDGAGPSGPYFDPSHELTVSIGERAKLMDFLAGGEVVLTTGARLPDVLTGKPGVVPAGLRSDGAWVWSEAAGYYLDRHHVAPEADLARHAGTRSPGSRLSPLERYRVRAALNPNDQEGPLWRAG